MASAAASSPATLAASGARGEAAAAAAATAAAALASGSASPEDICRQGYEHFYGSRGREKDVAKGRALIELAARACQPDYRGEGKTRGGLTPRGGEGVRGGAHVVETPLREGKEN